MSNDLHNQIRSTIRRALYSTLGIPMLALPVAMAQQATNQTAAATGGAPVKMEKTVVTGSLIPTAETVGPAPVDIVGAERIQQVGSQDVLATLKALNPGFAGNVNVGQTVNNGGFGEANVAIRNLSTLVLLNGRRLGNSAFSNGALVDVNTIPLSMIERIEVLKDGASALYGSEAVGGVVNIITKKNYTGAEISGRVGFPTQKTSNDLLEYRTSIVAGTSTEQSWITAGAQYYHFDPLLTKDRALASLGNAERAAMNLQAASYISPSFPGKVQARSGNGTRYLLANSPFLIGLKGYNPNLLGGPPDGSGKYNTPGSPPVFPGQTFSGPTAVDDYDTYAIAHGYVDPTGNGLGPYIRTSGAGAPSPLGSAQLNTTLFGTHSILSQDRRQIFGSGEHDLYGKQVQLFGQFLYSNNESVGALAPAPVISLGPFDSNINVPSNNVYNPFGINLGPDGSATPRIRSRFIQSGNRIFDALTDYYHIVAGLKGEFESGYTYNAAYTYDRYDQTQFTRNAVNGAALDLALQPNVDPALATAGFSRLRGPTGNFVPMYNIFFTPTEPFPTRTGPNSQTTIDAIKTTLFQSGQSEEWDMDGSITGEPFELPAGKLAFAIGGGFQSASLRIDFDGLTQIGKVPGLNAQNPTSGRRDAWSGFVEVKIPVISPDMNIPVFHSVEISAAGRYETFEPGGSSKVPKVLVRWQPLDEQVTLRGSYSQSFIAPTTFQLFGGSAQNNPFLSVADGTFQETTVNASTRTLKPVDAENYGGGVVFSPKCVKGLTLSADYYHIKTKHDIFRLSEQSMVNNLETNGVNSIYAPNFRFDDGSQLTTAAPNQITSGNWGSLVVPLANGAEQETYGLDLAASYQLATETAGKFTFYGNANYLLSYKYADPTIGGPFHYEGQYTDRINGIGGGQGLLPDYIINTGVTWEYPVRQDNLAVTINATYIPETDDPGTLHPAVGGTSNDFTSDGSLWKIDPWFKIDLQLAYEFGKNKTERDWYDGTTIRIGVSNITDEKPPIIASSFEDNTDKSSYDLLGRFVYFELAKKF